MTRIGDSDGDSEKRVTFGFLVLRKREVPVMVPPVPTPPRNTSTCPSVCPATNTCHRGDGAARAHAAQKHVHLPLRLPRHQRVSQR